MVNYAELRSQSRKERHILGLLQCNVDEKHLFSAKVLLTSMALAVVLLIGGCIHSNIAHAEQIIEGHTITQWTEAIHKAEGNDNYGILSVKCTKGAECRQICKNTVRNNFKRWKRSGEDISFVRFLGNRFAPVGTSKNPIKNDPTGLNRNWVKNVMYFLERNA